MNFKRTWIVISTLKETIKSASCSSISSAENEIFQFFYTSVESGPDQSGSITWYAEIPDKIFSLEKAEPFCNCGKENCPVGTYRPWHLPYLTSLMKSLCVWKRKLPYRDKDTYVNWQTALESSRSDLVAASLFMKPRMLELPCSLQLRNKGLETLIN